MIGGIFIMPEIFYEKMDELLFDVLKIEVEDTDDKTKIKMADNFIAIFTPEREPIVIS